MMCWWLWWEARNKEMGKTVNNPISVLLPSSVLYIVLAAKGRCLRQKNTMKSILLPPTLSNNIYSRWDVSFLQFSCFLNKCIYAFRWVLLQVTNWLNTQISWTVWSCSSFIKAAIKCIYWAICVREIKMNCKSLPINCRVCPTVRLLHVPVSGAGEVNILKYSG